MFFANWWNGLMLTEQIFYCIAIAATLFLLVETIMMFMGMDNDADFGDAEIPDADFDVADGIFGENEISEISDTWGLEGLKIFTVRGIVAFFVVFGWVGALMTGMGVALPITIPVAFVCGAAMMVLMAYLMKAVLKLKSNGNSDNRNAVGKSGKVYLTVPAERRGEGKVNIMLQGSLTERNAVTDSKEAIPTGSEVVVIGLSGETTLLVKKK